MTSAVIWEFAPLQWCYSINHCVSVRTYISWEKAFSASQRPQHFSRSQRFVRPVRTRANLWGLR